MILSTDLPPDRYDYIANLAQNSDEALQREIKKKFGVVGNGKPGKRMFCCSK